MTKMPDRRRSVLALLLLLALAPAGRAQTADPRLEGLDAYVESAMRAWKVPGLALAVVRGDRVVYAKGYGVRELGQPGAVDANTAFAVASNTKAMTAAALGLLVDTGRLTWDTPVADVLPALSLKDPWATRELTVRDLLSHRTGYETWGGDLLWYGSTLPTREVLRRVRFLDPITSFRSTWGYTNLMYVAAGAIIPAVTDTSWADFVQAHFLRPLGMSRTTTGLPAMEALGNVARPHTLVAGEVRSVPFRDLESAAPAAAINSTVTDWANWLRLNLRDGTFGGRRLISAASLRELRQPHSIRRLSEAARRNFPTTHFLLYGLGWDLRDHRGRLIVSHTGGMDGMLSMTGFVPEDSLAVAVFTNYDEQSLYSALFWHVLDRMMAGERVDYSARFRAADTPEPVAPPPPPSRPSLPLAGYAGTYTNPMMGTATVGPCGTFFCISLEHHPGLRGPLEHYRFDTFQVAWNDVYFRESLVTFELGPDGRPARLRFRVRPDFVDPQEYVFEKR
jgi:CubicO group peptidase (beta-lactamase class C family)